MSEQDKQLWDRVALEFHKKIGADGENDPVRSKCVDSMLLTTLSKECTSTARVLDVGSGNGYFVRKMRKYGYHAVGLDISSELLRIAREHSPCVTFYEADIECRKSLPSGIWDAIVCSFVLDGVRDLDAALSCIHQLLSPGGVLIVNIPHPAFVNGTFGGEKHSQTLYVEDDHFGSDYIMQKCTFPVRYYWRPVSRYINAIITSKFDITSLVEPSPTDVHDYIAGTGRPRQHAYVLGIAARRHVG